MAPARRFTFCKRFAVSISYCTGFPMRLGVESRVTSLPRLRNALVGSPYEVPPLAVAPCMKLLWLGPRRFTLRKRFRCCIDFLQPRERPLTHPRLSRDYTLFILSLENTPNRWWELGRSLVSLVSDCHFSFVFMETKNVEYHGSELEVCWYGRPQRARPASCHP